MNRNFIITSIIIAAIIIAVVSIALRYHFKKMSAIKNQQISGGLPVTTSNDAYFISESQKQQLKNACSTESGRIAVPNVTGYPCEHFGY